MSAAGERVKPDAEDAEEMPTPRQMSERTAKTILCLVALGAGWAVVVAVPYVAYFVAGVLVTLGVQKARARCQRHYEDDTTAKDRAAQPDLGEALRHLVGDDNGVLLTHLRNHLGLPDTKTVKHLLDADNIPWKGVRTSHGNGPGVHKNDIPPALPSPAAGSHGEGCCCRSDDNTNTNNSPEEEPEEGLHVEAIGQAGTLVHDPTEASRHHDLTH